MSDKLPFKIGMAFKTATLIVINSAVLLLVLNIALAAFFILRDDYGSGSENPITAKYGSDPLSAVYPDLDRESIDRLLSETWSRPLLYEPFTQFRERPYTGRFVNVDEHGFRVSKNQGPWPPAPENYNIFVFGGSTTFGYGLPDSQTTPSFLQEALNERVGIDVRVYNFGRAYYYSTQERILFESLLVSGFVPDMALFVDGLNDFYQASGEPHFTRRLARVVDGDKGHRVTTWLKKVIAKLPMTRLARALQPSGEVESSTSETTASTAADIEIIKAVINRYAQNKTLIEAAANAYEIRTVFVWQPVPTFNYDLDYHPFANHGEIEGHARSGNGYRYMAESLRMETLGDNFVWSADIQAGLREPFYVDIVHYNATMSRLLARSIADAIVTRDLTVPVRTRSKVATTKSSRRKPELRAR